MYVDKDTKKQICVGDPVKMREGIARVTSMAGGRIYVSSESGIPNQPYGVFPNVVNAEWVDVDERTLEVHEWMKALSDADKMRFALNWRIPHSLFNVACGLRSSEELQGINWYYIYKTKDLGRWSHGGKVYVQSFS